MAVKTMSGSGLAARPRWQPLRTAGPAGNRVVWVYAITDDLGPREFPGLSGVGGERIRVVADAGLAAVVGSVEARSFGEDALASLLGGLDNIERVGRAHHQVIARAAAGGGPVLPLRLATVYPDDDTVRALLARNGSCPGVRAYSGRAARTGGPAAVLPGRTARYAAGRPGLLPGHLAGGA